MDGRTDDGCAHFSYVRMRAKYFILCELWMGFLMVWERKRNSWWHCRGPRHLTSTAWDSNNEHTTASAAHSHRNANEYCDSEETETVVFELFIRNTEIEMHAKWLSTEWACWACVCVCALCVCAIACSDVHSMVKAFFLFKNKLQKVFRCTKWTVIIMGRGGLRHFCRISIFIMEYGCPIQTLACAVQAYFSGAGIEGCGADQSHGTHTAPQLIRKNEMENKNWEMMEGTQRPFGSIKPSQSDCEAKQPLSTSQWHGVASGEIESISPQHVRRSPSRKFDFKLRNIKFEFLVPQIFSSIFLARKKGVSPVLVSPVSSVEMKMHKIQTFL